MKPDDLIISLGGEKIATIRDFERVLATLRPGEEAAIVFKRGNDLIRAMITPTHSP
jgi:S1-C subfamily serine protease